jgi:hypothetical protein
MRDVLVREEGRDPEKLVTRSIIGGCQQEQMGGKGEGAVDLDNEEPTENDVLRTQILPNHAITIPAGSASPA